MNVEEILDSDFRGIIHIVKDNKILCEKVTGFADFPNKVPNTLETKFASASAGKVFVAVGVLQLNRTRKVKI